MRFWDTSAIVPLLVVESATADMRRFLDSDPAIVVWWTTRTEAVSALARQARDGGLGASPAAHARTVLDALSATWSEVVPSEQLRTRAERLLRVHALRAGDAFQLSAALLWSRGQTSGRGFVSLDDRLREAAGREGFRVLPD